VIEVELARAFPDTLVTLIRVGGIIGIGCYRLSQRSKALYPGEQAC
jgi:hypothetical protein